MEWGAQAAAGTDLEFRVLGMVNVVSASYIVQGTDNPFSTELTTVSSLLSLLLRAYWRNPLTNKHQTCHQLLF